MSIKEGMVIIQQEEIDIKSEIIYENTLDSNCINRNDENVINEQAKIKDRAIIFMDEIPPIILPPEKSVNTVNDSVDESEDNDPESKTNGKEVNKKRFTCQFCYAKFALKGTLTIHIRVHTLEKPFNCSKCDKKFAHKSSLTIHLRTHTGEKPFTCANCNKKFGNKSHLKRHLMVVHKKERPYGCPNCNKKFQCKSDVTRHLRSHTGEKPFGCPNCNKKFSYKSGLKRHLNLPTACDHGVTFTDEK